MYKITDYSLNKARQLNVTIRPSGNKKKKIDVPKIEDPFISIKTHIHFVRTVHC